MQANMILGLIAGLIIGGAIGLLYAAFIIIALLGGLSYAAMKLPKVMAWLIKEEVSA